MKKQFLLIAYLLLGYVSFSQNVVLKSVTIDGKLITGIKDDASNSTLQNNLLITEAAVRQMINESTSGSQLKGITNTQGDLVADYWAIYQDGKIEISESLDLYPDGSASFAANKSKLEADGGGHLANWAIYWDAAGNLSNINNGAWSISNEGAARFKYIDNTYFDDFDIARRVSLSSGGVAGNENNDGVVNGWSLGTSGLSLTYSEDGGDTYSSNTYINKNEVSFVNGAFGVTSGGVGNTSGSGTWSITDAGYVYFQNVSFDNGGITSDGTGLIRSRGISIQNTSDVEVGYISSNGMVAFDNYNISSDGNGNFTAATLNANNGATGVFSSPEGYIITVVNGVITGFESQQ